MASKLFFIAFIGLVLFVIAAKSIVTTKEGERLVVFRLGKLLGVFPPGRTIKVPFIDRGIKVRVDQIPGWQTMSEGELLRAIAEVAERQL